MNFRTKLLAFGRKFKLDSHHGIERFGVFVAIFAVSGVLVIGGATAAAFKANGQSLDTTAVYNTSFTTSKTQMDGRVDGVYRNKTGSKAMVLMHFDGTAQISYNAADYRAFLLGSDANLHTQTVATKGIKGSFHVFGSTGYVAVVLNADEPFHKQVLNLTVRATKELSHDQKSQSQSAVTKTMAGDPTFRKYDQWRVFINPGASHARHIAALDAPAFDAGRVYYDTILKPQEASARGALDAKLSEMRSDLTRVQSYSQDLLTTKVDGLFLRQPPVPAGIAGDAITGHTASESTSGRSNLSLHTTHVVPGGFNFDWRAGNISDGYLDALVPSGSSYVQWLTNKMQTTDSSAATDAADQQISDLKWTLSDGSDLKTDYQASDVTMRPLVAVMNNLSQAYSDYSTDKSDYQDTLLLNLLKLEVKLRDVHANDSVNSDSRFLLSLY